MATLPSDFFELVSADLTSTDAATQFLRFLRTHRSFLRVNAALSRVIFLAGQRLFKLGERGSFLTADEYFSVLEQTATAAAAVGAVDEAQAIAKVLAERFGEFKPKKMVVDVDRAEGDTGPPAKMTVWSSEGSQRAHLLAQLVLEAGGSVDGPGGAKKGLDELKDVKPTLAVSRRLSSLALAHPEREKEDKKNTIAKTLAEHLEMFSDDADAWREASELLLSDDFATGANFTKAAFAAEEVVLISPEDASAHARASELCVAAAVKDFRDNSASKDVFSHVVFSFRCARLKAAEAVSLSRKGSAYALAALADSAFLHLTSFFAQRSGKCGKTDVLQDDFRLLRAEPLKKMAAAIGGHKVSAARPVPLRDSLGGSTDAEESTKLHSLAMHHLRRLQDAFAPELSVMIKREVTVDGELIRLRDVFGALSFEHSLLTDPRALRALQAQEEILRALKVELGLPTTVPSTVETEAAPELPAVNDLD